MDETNVAEVVSKEIPAVEVPSLAKQLYLGVESSYLDVPFGHEIPEYNHCGLRIPKSIHLHFDEREFRYKPSFLQRVYFFLDQL